MEGGFAREEVRLANRNPGTLLGLRWRGWRFEWQATPVVRCEGHLRALRRINSRLRHCRPATKRPLMHCIQWGVREPRRRDMQHRIFRTALTAAALTLTSTVALHAQYAPPPPTGYAPPPSYPASPNDQPAQPAQAYDPAQLDQMLASIALYPDQLLGQILMASTYPAEIDEAAAWLQDPRNARLRGDALAAALEQQDWDPSVKSLVAFPDVIQMLASHRDWTQQLGDAFLADQAGVMDSVQRLRHEAWNTGKLRSTPQQQVTMRGSDIVIESANPGVVYVPTYNPTAVYGDWAYPDYPPYYFGPEGYGYGGTLAFGPGFGITRDWDWDRFDWREHRVHVDRDRMSWWDRGRPERFRADRAAGDFWMHNPEHRRGVDYRNPALRERYQNANIAPDQRQGRDRTWGTSQGASPNVEGPAGDRRFPNGQFQRAPERLQQGNAGQNGRERNAQPQYPQNRNAGQQHGQERNAQQQPRPETRPMQTGPTALREGNVPRQEIGPRAPTPGPRQEVAPRAPAPGGARNPETFRGPPQPEPRGQAAVPQARPNVAPPRSQEPRQAATPQARQNVAPPKPQEPRQAAVPQPRQNVAPPRPQAPAPQARQNAPPPRPQAPGKEHDRNGG